MLPTKKRQIRTHQQVAKTATRCPFNVASLRLKIVILIASMNNPLNPIVNGVAVVVGTCFIIRNANRR